MAHRASSNARGTSPPAHRRSNRAIRACAGVCTPVSRSCWCSGSASPWSLRSATFRTAALLFAILAFTLYLFGSAEIWRRLLHALGPDLPPLRAASIWFASGLGRYVPSALLLPVLRMAMAEREGVPKRITLASVAYEVALFFTGSVIVGAYFVITLPDLQGIWERYLVLVLPAIALIAIHPRVFHPIADWALTRTGRAQLPLSLSGARSLEFVGMYAAACLMAGLAVYCLAQAVFPVGADDLPTVVSSYAVANTVSILAFVLPGRLGAREASMAVALSPVMPTAPPSRSRCSPESF